MSQLELRAQNANLMMKPKILILHATGTNRDRDVAWACELADGLPQMVHINQSLGARWW